jgi:hypothetical protein
MPDDWAATNIRSPRLPDLCSSGLSDPQLEATSSIAAFCPNQVMCPPGPYGYQIHQWGGQGREDARSTDSEPSRHGVPTARRSCDSLKLGDLAQFVCEDQG